MKEQIINGIKYRLNEDTLTAKVIQDHDNDYNGDIVIPKKVEFEKLSYCVTSIGDWAFDGCEYLISITIPDGVISIGDSAFWGCKKLATVTIPDSVKIIGNQAFFACSSLTSITIPDSVKIMGESAFENCISLEIITYIGTPTQWNNWQRGNAWRHNTPSKIVVEPMAMLINGIN